LKDKFRASGASVCYLFTQPCDWLNVLPRLWRLKKGSAVSGTGLSIPLFLNDGKILPYVALSVFLRFPRQA
jgi:hypothetical protein